MRGSKKTKKKFGSGSVRVTPTVLDEAREICRTRGWLLSNYVTTCIQYQNDVQNAKSGKNGN